MNHILINSSLIAIALVGAVLLLGSLGAFNDPFKQREAVQTFFNLHVKPLGNLASIAWGHITKGLFESGGESLGMIRRDGGQEPEENMTRRDITIVRDSADVEKRSVKAILSTENKIKTYYRGDIVNETLVHEAGAVNMERAEGGLPLLFNHDRDRQIGMIENVRVEDRQLVGDLKFSRSAFAEEIFQDIQDGIRRHMSISASREAVDEVDDHEIKVTSWMPVEGSVVTIPADVRATIRRDDNGGQGGGDVVDFKANRDKIRREGTEEGAKIERARISKIRELFERHYEKSKSTLVRDLMDDCISRGDSIARSSERLLELIGDGLEPVSRDYTQDQRSGSQDQRGARATAGDDQIDKYVEGATNGILVRAGLVKGDEARKLSEGNQYRGFTLGELAREYLRIQNHTIRDNRLLMVGDAFTHRTITHGTSDFANVLENVAQKAMLMGWDEAEETWSRWCRIGNLQDFRQASRVNISEFPDLDLVEASGEYKYAKMLDLKETIQLFTYGKLFSISRQAIINDDVTAFTRIPAAMARAANRKVGDLAYLQLTSNPTLNQDSTALFHANHNNLKASGSSAPTVARVNAIRAAMGTQTGLQAAADGPATLNIRPVHLMCPLALEGTARALAEAQYDPAGSAGTLTPNTVQGTFDVTADARLDADSATAWYMAGNENIHDTIEVAFLDGNPNPFLEEQNGWSVDGREYKVRIDVGASPLDFRALYKDVGTA